MSVFEVSFRRCGDMRFRHFHPFRAIKLYIEHCVWRMVADATARIRHKHINSDNAGPGADPLGHIACGRNAQSFPAFMCSLLNRELNIISSASENPEHQTRAYCVDEWSSASRNYFLPMSAARQQYMGICHYIPFHPIPSYSPFLAALTFVLRMAK